MQWHIADEVNVFDNHHSCLSVMDLIIKVGLSKTISNVGLFYHQLIIEFIVNLPLEFSNPSSPDYQTVYIIGSKFKIFPAISNGFLGNTVESSSTPSHPSNDVFASVLSGETLSIWPLNRISTVSLSVKYAILYKIGIANCFPSSHASCVSVALGIFLYQICNDDSVNTSLFIYK